MRERVVVGKITGFRIGFKSSQSSPCEREKLKVKTKEAGPYRHGMEFFTLKETRNVLLQVVLSQSLHFKFLFPILCIPSKGKVDF